MFYTLTFTPYYIFVEMHLVFYDRIAPWLLIFQRIDVCPPSLEDKYDQTIEIIYVHTYLETWTNKLSYKSKTLFADCPQYEISRIWFLNYSSFVFLICIIRRSMWLTYFTDYSLFQKWPNLNLLSHAVSFMCNKISWLT